MGLLVVAYQREIWHGRRDIGRRELHCVSKKVPTLNSLQLCQILTDFQNFCTAEKHMKFATKPI